MTTHALDMVEHLQQIITSLAFSEQLEDPATQKCLMQLIRDKDFITVFGKPTKTLRVALLLADDDSDTEKFADAVQDWIDSL